jgi:hypothetical protein
MKANGCLALRPDEEQNHSGQPLATRDGKLYLACSGEQGRHSEFGALIGFFNCDSVPHNCRG